MKAVGGSRAFQRRGWKQIASDSWPTQENRPIATLKLEPDDLQERFGLEFSLEQDDLDGVRVAVVELPSGSVMGLVRYEHAPEPGTGLFAEETAPVEKELGEFLQAFDLTPVDVSRQVPER